VSPVNLGFFAAGLQLDFTVTGFGDLVDARYQVLPDGSLLSAASGGYTYANPGQPYPDVSGFPAGDGVNHFVGGGGNYDFTGSGWMFAGLQTTDTTDPGAIRAGAVVGTFAASPTRADWFLIGFGGTVTIPTGGANLYLAVNDSVNWDNHGTYTVSFQSIPEPGTWLLFGTGLAILMLNARRRGFRPGSGPAP
jgi:hypothetical protein